MAANVGIDGLWHGKNTIIIFPSMVLRLTQIRCEIVARDALHFRHAGNTFRGALLLRAAEKQVPFVLRVAHLDGRTIRAGGRFDAGLNVFDPRPAESERLLNTLREVIEGGLGPGRGRGKVVGEELRTLVLPLEPPETGCCRLRVSFRTATELKDAGRAAERPEFRILLARAAARIERLRARYANDPADIRALVDRARNVKLIHCELSSVARFRRSTRTGQVHAIGGFTGEARYQGELTEFLPWLRAAEHTGVGRHTAWGNGEIQVTPEAG